MLLVRLLILLCIISPPDLWWLRYDSVYFNYFFQILQRVYFLFTLNNFIFLSVFCSYTICYDHSFSNEKCDYCWYLNLRRWHALFVSVDVSFVRRTNIVNRSFWNQVFYLISLHWPNRKIINYKIIINNNTKNSYQPEHSNKLSDHH